MVAFPRLLPELRQRRVRLPETRIQFQALLQLQFSRLHPAYKTPVNSIILVGAASFGIASLSLVGVGQAEAFQLLFNASGMFYALTYVVMFAVARNSSCNWDAGSCPVVGVAELSPGIVSGGTVLGALLGWTTSRDRWETVWPSGARRDSR